PAQPLAPAGAEALEDGLLGRPAPGEVFNGPLARLAVAHLALGVDAAQEQLAVLLDHAADAQALHDVGADANDFHDGRTFSPTGTYLLILAERGRECKIGFELSRTESPDAPARPAVRPDARPARGGRAHG